MNVLIGSLATLLVASIIGLFKSFIDIQILKREFMLFKETFINHENHDDKQHDKIENMFKEINEKLNQLIGENKK